MSFRNTINKDGNEFKCCPYPEVKTIWDAFVYQARRLPNHPYVGSRDPT